MRMNSSPIRAKRALLMDYLQSRGYLIGRTHSGFVAVDGDGIVFTVSPCRTYGTISHPQSGELRELRARGQAEPEWFEETEATLIEWAKSPLIRKCNYVTN